LGTSFCEYINLCRDSPDTMCCGEPRLMVYDTLLLGSVVSLGRRMNPF
jgi:hypothetical protein